MPLKGLENLPTFPEPKFNADFNSAISQQISANLDTLTPENVYPYCGLSPENHCTIKRRVTPFVHLVLENSTGSLFPSEVHHAAVVHWNRRGVDEKRDFCVSERRRNVCQSNLHSNRRQSNLQSNSQGEILHGWDSPSAVAARHSCAAFALPRGTRGSE